ncbi:MAG: DMSO reductase [Rhodospirillaceae bacterium]|nr:DMSO reductase [Magnetovibrio sp.]MAY68656.1 DMSO reductase [Rhodospirillaceae bacterium]
MHPAFSVIFFTVSSGAGYGLLALVGALGAAGLLPADRLFGLTAIILALAAVTAGLLSSTFHLGHPERAWRAFSQWRSSWLSREGVASVLTYGPALALAAVWMWPDRFGAYGPVAGAASAVMALVTIYCTAMIYRSLATIHQWSNGWVVPSYLVLGLATGLVWLNALLVLFGAESYVVAVASMWGVLAAAAIKVFYWRFIDTTRHAATPESATGLGALGKVRYLEGPHTEQNYLLNEMGYRVARKHALKLRRIVLIGGYLAAICAVGVGLKIQGPGEGALALLGAALATAGTLVERWLFFAEARHVVTLYYGADRA